MRRIRSRGRASALSSGAPRSKAALRRSAFDARFALRLCFLVSLLSPSSGREAAALAPADAGANGTELGAVNARANDPGAFPAAPILAAPTTSFDPRRDIFAFGNGLRWEYETGYLATHREGAPPAPPPGDYDQRCSQMSRAARQFFRHARFDPDAPPLPDDVIEARIETVMQRDPRARHDSDDPILFPGFADLRTFSERHEGAIKRHIGARWRAYLQRGNWRMIFHYSDRHQQSTAQSLLDDLADDHPAIVHLVRFPRISINHTLLVHRAVATTEGIDFYTYDPNHPGLEIAMRYDRAEAEFSLQPTFYWPGGRVIAYEIFDGFLY